MANNPNQNERDQQQPGKTGQPNTGQQTDTSKRGYTSIEEDQETAGQRSVSTEGRRTEEPETDEETSRTGKTSRETGDNR